ncbi:hypothetical protein C0J52_00355, partial [Blattella germanica]
QHSLRIFLNELVEHWLIHQIILAIRDLLSFPGIFHHSMCSAEGKHQQLETMREYTILSPSGALVLFQHIRMGMPNNGS